MVALRKESVDRNIQALAQTLLDGLSLSARRAWIEMAYVSSCGARRLVALRKESVDRNINSVAEGAVPMSRSPQGERG